MRAPHSSGMRSPHLFHVHLNAAKAIIFLPFGQRIDSLHKKGGTQ